MFTLFKYSLIKVLSWRTWFTCDLFWPSDRVKFQRCQNNICTYLIRKIITWNLFRIILKIMYLYFVWSYHLQITHVGLPAVYLFYKETKSLTYIHNDVVGNWNTFSLKCMPLNYYLHLLRNKKIIVKSVKSSHIVPVDV